ncbi:M1 family metallopeptidase [Goodfellowiella coeruleoviolacea]|uniref:Aminopeptidase N n=1 Tax=Goodfellowiella coeruleoviolacea TaxID=334858 RepID=A0AAE3GGY6_9PSEU|nr:M1 family metallopeptidase [Goodfellowiella coeruleoviolacea]MCP2165943.1 Peptidase family M1 [Goodfellowiella coeruleoviolacea]
MSARSRFARAGLGVLGAACALTLFAGTAGAAVGQPGADSIGDPYYPGAGNGGYDVAHYDIRLTYQPATDQLAGTTTILARTTQDLSSFNLDFLLKVSSVRVNNAPAQFSQADGELVVRPAASLAKNTDVTVVVRYADVPSTVEHDGYTSWVRTADGALAVDEPNSAPWWFPSNNHPLDKATYDVSVAVPDDVSALSNGTLVRTSKDIAGWTRWSWRSTQPQATYLAFLVVGKYDIHSGTAPNGQPFLTAYGADLGASTDAAKASVQRTPEILDFLSDQFGAYPFEAQGGVVSTGLGFALETQTRPVYSDRFFLRGSNTSVVVHENAHQWFGDSVSVHGWRDIWLNEGFASYAEWLWSEAEGEGTAQQLADYIYDYYPADHEFWQVLPGDPGPENQFDDAVYDRGALTLQALRNAVGDEAFFTIIRTWVAEHRYGNGTIEQFVALAEKISGKPLYDLFQTWLFTKGKPADSAAVGVSSAPARATVAEPKSFATLRETHALLARSGG